MDDKQVQKHSQKQQFKSCCIVGTEQIECKGVVGCTKKKHTASSCIRELIYIGLFSRRLRLCVCTHTAWFHNKLFLLHRGQHMYRIMRNSLKVGSAQMFHRLIFICPEINQL